MISSSVGEGAFCCLTTPSTEAGRCCCSPPVSPAESNSGKDLERFLAICTSEEQEEDAESMVSQGESDESLLEKEVAPMTIPLSGDWPLLLRSLEQLIRVVVSVLAGIAE